ncbi:hypothetical protein FACS189472_01140 [Alphaproteobacteria bacterium]|nr:hypothetical protein FACS189472_01140 [Alphaproteobacteria bacterium]
MKRILLAGLLAFLAHENCCEAQNSFGGQQSKRKPLKKSYPSKKRSTLALPTAWKRKKKQRGKNLQLVGRGKKLPGTRVHGRPGNFQNRSTKADKLRDSGKRAKGSQSDNQKKKDKAEDNRDARKEQQNGELGKAPSIVPTQNDSGMSTNTWTGSSSIHNNSFDATIPEVAPPVVTTEVPKPAAKAPIFNSQFIPASPKVAKDFTGVPQTYAYCYSNSTMQVLYHSGLAALLKNSKSTKKFPAALRDFFDTMERKRGGTLDTPELLQMYSSFCTAAKTDTGDAIAGTILEKFGGPTIQHDGHEFITEIFGRLPEDVLVDYQIGVTRTLSHDGIHSRENTDYGNLMLTVSVPAQYNPKHTLNTAITNYLGSEQVENKCEHCNAKMATSTPRFSSLPPTLIVHQNRFGTTRRLDAEGKAVLDKNGRAIEDGFKLETPVLYEQKLQLEDDTGKHIYMACAVLVHAGSTGSGHYTANIIHGDTLVRCDGSQISEMPLPVSPDNPNLIISNGLEYVIFYKRVS